MPVSFLRVTDGSGAVIAPEWLSRVEPVHRQLRDRLPPGFDVWQQTLQNVFANGGRMVLAAEGETVKGVAVWRILDTSGGRHLFVDDLVTDMACRSQAIGRGLINWLENEARACSCAMLSLTSNVARNGAHRFYFREGFFIASYYFRKNLG
ncbi:MAG: GNAT family N-acetyltransferase [Betaproteobacteria bacterium]|nr:GNAT family N-acetyltransferase [Betaproteobacteria bacterium]